MKSILLYFIVFFVCIGAIYVFTRIMINTKKHKENEQKAYKNFEQEMKI